MRKEKSLKQLKFWKNPTMGKHNHLVMKHLKDFSQNILKKASKALNELLLKEVSQEVQSVIHGSINSETVKDAIKKTRGVACLSGMEWNGMAPCTYFK